MALHHKPVSRLFSDFGRRLWCLFETAFPFVFVERHGRYCNSSLCVGDRCLREPARSEALGSSRAQSGSCFWSRHVWIPYEAAPQKQPLVGVRTPSRILFRFLRSAP